MTSNTHKNIIAGPFVGEFGWELFSWQGHLRWLSAQGHKLYVFCRSGLEYLYNDHAKQVVSLYFENPGANCIQCHGLNPRRLAIKNHDLLQLPSCEPNEYLNPHDTLLFWPPDKEFERFKDQKFRIFGTAPLDYAPQIIIHARKRQIVATGRNWPDEKWDNLCKRFADSGFNIAAIGTHSAAYCPEYALDLRGISIQETCNFIGNARVAVGPSSGPMHLASLCATPHVVWGASSNIPRYKTHWNPHNTPCIYHARDKWNPTVNDVYGLTLQIMDPKPEHIRAN